MSRIVQLTAILDALTDAAKQYGGNAVGIHFDQVCQTRFSVADGIEFIADYKSLIEQIEKDIEAIPNLSEKHKASFLSTINMVRNIFNSSVFAGN